jgi:hypothetical protein
MLYFGSVGVILLLVNFKAENSIRSIFICNQNQARSQFLSAVFSKILSTHSFESFGLIEIKGRYYDADALAVARAVAEMSSFGIEARHLRSFKTAADREVGLVEQVITPLLRQKGTEAGARAEEVQRELASLSIRLHAALVASGLHRSKS